MKKYIFIMFFALGQTASSQHLMFPSGVYPITTLDSKTDSKSYAPLARLLTNIDIVGMGEPIHGSHIFHEWRGSAIKYLIQNEGFRFVAFESPWSNAYATEQYIETCEGDPRTAVEGLYFMLWMDESVLDLVKWLCVFNQKHPDDKAVLFGIDVQNPKHDRSYILDFFDRVDPDFKATIDEGITGCLDFESKLDSKAVDFCKAQIALARKHLSQNKNKFEKLTSKKAVFSAQAAFRSLWFVQKQILFSHSIDTQERREASQARDEGMTKNLLAFRGFYSAKKKGIVYAHNWHVATNTTDFPERRLNTKSMGTFLSEYMGDKYAAVGSIGYEVEVNQKVFPYPNPPIPTDPRSVELNLNLLKSNYLLVDTKGGYFENGGRYLLQDAAWAEMIVPTRHYSALFFSSYSGPLKYIFELTKP